MSNSSLVNATYLSNNCYGYMNKIVGVTVHCVVGYMSMEAAGSWFGKPSTNASCNYFIDKDGQVALIVPENKGSWCSSSQSNDCSHITIECACTPDEPYTFPDATYKKLVKLVADIYKRNGIAKATWTGDTNGNITAHYFFKNKSCPGAWFRQKLDSGEFCRLVNAELKGGQDAGEPVNNNGIWYRSHSQDYGWNEAVHDGQTSGIVGESKRIEAFKFDFKDIPIESVKLHVQGIGWETWYNPKAETIIGTVGESKRIEAIEINAKVPEGKKLMYRVHIQDIGWQQWVENGYSCGTIGQSKRIEAIQIKLV